MQARMRQTYFLAVVTVAVGVLFGAAALAQSNASLGTWKLNVAKSKFDPGPPPMSRTDVWDAWENDGVKVNVTIVGADGSRITGGVSFHYDGKDYKVTGTPPPADFDTIAFKRVSKNTTAFTIKKGGKVVETGREVLSSKGKTRTATGTGTNAKGQNVHEVLVWDKQ
jgi:hypothetical protein